MIKSVLLKTIYVLSSVFQFFSQYFSSNNRISVICYHKTSPKNKCSDEYWNVSPDNFKMQMQYLYDSGFTTLYTYEIPDILKKRKWNKKYVCITFDDGYNDNYENAYQIIKQFNFKANFYISTNYIDNNYQFPFLIKKNMIELSSIMPIKKKQLLEMSQNQISIQSHSHMHEMQSNMTRKNISIDIKKSLTYLNKHLKQKNSNTSYVSPFGVHGLSASKVKIALRELGIPLAFLGKWGSVTPGTELINMKRIPIYGRDNMNEFKLKIKGAYDWVGVLQEFYKDNMNGK